MKITLSDDALRHIAAFEEVTGATARDCLLQEDHAVFLVAPGEMGTAIGPDGRTVERLEERLGRDIDLVEDADTPEAFVANAFAPAVVNHVTISEQGDRIANVEVAERDRGLAIGADGRTIEIARELAARHFDVDDIQLT